MGLKHLRTTQSSPQEPLGDLQARGERSGTEAGFDPFAVAFYASCTLHACRVPVVEFPRICPLAAQIFLLDLTQILVHFCTEFTTIFYNSASPSGACSISEASASPSPRQTTRT